jgi:phage/plasmid-like protein (TIGR03299 family)
MHNLEVVEDMVTFASRREPAWHGLGQVINADSLTWEEIGEAAHLLNWNVRAVPLSEIQPEWNFGKKNPQVIVRNNPANPEKIDWLGNATDKYNVFQNEDALRFADSLVNDVDAQNVGTRSWETAGSIDEGRKIFGSLALEREIAIDPNGVSDKVKTYLIVTTSHDGSMRLTVFVTPVRVVCQNTLNFAFSGADQFYKIKHTQNMDNRVEEAQNALGIANNYMNVFQTTAQELFEIPVDSKKFYEIVEVIHGKKPEANTKGRITKWQNNVDQAFDLWRGETQQGIANTAWGALNALTEQDQWFRGIRKETDNFFIAGSGLDDAANKSRQNILNKVLQVTNV